jgi:dihydroorotate dehydrogenase electron transfer subunit
LDLVPEFEAWADQAFAFGPYDFCAALARIARGRQARLGVAALRGRRAGKARRRSWLQVSIDQNIGCAIGTCLGCVIMGADGPQRVCREGPVFASDDIAWESRWP